MLETIKEKLKQPVTTLINDAENEDLKKCGIKLAIIAVVNAVLNLITTIISIFSRYSKDYMKDLYSSSELWDKKWEAIKDAELISGFFRMWVITVIVVAVMALILFIIAKIVKSPKDYSKNLSMVNNTAIIFLAGSIINTIISLIYAPLGLLILFATIIYASYTLIYAFKDSLEVQDSNLLVLATTGVITAVIVILVVVLSSVTGVSFSDITSVMDLLNF